MVGFRIEDLTDFEENIRREWVLTNGIGGYAGGSVTGALNRTHQGYLIASLHPPVERYTALSKTEERVMAADCVTDISASCHRKGDRDTVCDGNRYMNAFLCDGAVTFAYEIGSLRIRKTLALQYGENKCAILYRVENIGEAARLIVTPHFNWHEHGTPNSEESVKKVLPEDCVRTFDRTSNTGTADSGAVSGRKIQVLPKADKAVTVDLCFSDGRLQERSEKYDINISLKTETDNEAEGLECTFRPYDIVLEVGAGESKVLGCICEVKTAGDKTCTDGGKCDDADIPAEAQTIISDARERAGELAGRACRNPEAFPLNKHILGSSADVSDRMLFEALSQAADNFIAYRSSTGLSTVLAGLPWFTDWGRDTMIAFTGLTLVTGRYGDAAAILRTFAQYVKDGLVPNMFPDDGQEPLYNTADASLWYFYAVHKYLEYAGEAGSVEGSADPYAFVRAEIYPCLKQIIDGYRNGTRFSIRMDKDALIHAGGGFDQVTWMDVRVGDWVATPRHGKPVEINALWYNALMIIAGLAQKYDDPDAADYAELAGKVKKSFRERFWYEEGGYLFDVVDCDEDSLPAKKEPAEDSDEPDAAFNRAVERRSDPRLRPNQIYAVSLPFALLDPGQERSVTDIVREKLYAGCGLRSLDPADPDYHPIYLGSLEKRDHAYHQGTAWGFLLGAFITAYVKTHGYTDEARREAGRLITPVKEHLFQNCIGSICEIFDGDAPHNGRGCYAQAWSVGEILRCLYEDILR